MVARLPNDCWASIQFLKWQKLYERERPFHILIDVPKDAPDQRTTNLVYEDVDQYMTDVRGYEDTFDLDGNGFKYLRKNIDFQEFNDAEAVHAGYFPEVERILRENVEEADEIFLFGWRIRSSSKAPVGSAFNLSDSTHWLRPARTAHVDHTPGSLVDRIRLQLPERAETLLKGRVRQINVWKPIKHIVEDWPLAVSDGSRINLDRLVETDHVRREFTGPNFNLMHTPGLQWHFLDRQGPDEILLIKNFDSSGMVKAKRCPHVSFHHPKARTNAPIRESVEVRALVFTNHT